MKKNLILYPQKGIYVILNKKNKRFLLVETNDFFKSVGDNLSKIRNGKHSVSLLNSDWKELEIKFLEKQEYRDIRKQHLLYWNNRLVDKGYTSYRPINQCQFKPIITTFRPNETLNPHVFFRVGLYISGTKEITVAVFEKYEYAESFVEQYYKNCDIVYPIYGTNELSRQYTDS